MSRIKTQQSPIVNAVTNANQHSLLNLITQYNEDELNRSHASATAVKLQNVEIGYFQSLNANFRSTEEDIRK